jgi:ABC-type transporter MlaC component
MLEATKEQLEKFVKQIMEIERRYGNELKNVKGDRQEEIQGYLEKFASRELDDEDS